MKLAGSSNGKIQALSSAVRFNSFIDSALQQVMLSILSLEYIMD